MWRTPAPDVENTLVEIRLPTGPPLPTLVDPDDDTEDSDNQDPLQPPQRAEVKNAISATTCYHCGRVAAQTWKCMDLGHLNEPPEIEMCYTCAPWHYQHYHGLEGVVEFINDMDSTDGGASSGPDSAE